MPMHFFRILQMLTSFLENMGAGRAVLGESNIKKKEGGKHREGYLYHMVQLY